MENPEDRSDEETGLFAAASNEEEGEGEEAEGEEGESEEEEEEEEEEEGEEPEEEESEGEAEAEEEESEEEEDGEEGEEEEEEGSEEEESEEEESEEEESEEEESEEDGEEEDGGGEDDGGDGDGGDGGDGGGDDDDGDDDDDDGDGDDDGELAALDDEEVFGSADDYEAATEEDFEDDDGSWDDGEYEEAAEHIFGQEEYYGESPDERYIEMGWEPAPADEAQHYAAVIDRVIPGVSQTTRFWHDGGTVKAQGFLPAKALRAAKKKLPEVDFSAVHATIARKRGKKKPGKLPGALGKIDARDVVDLRKYCTPVGDQGGSSRCSAFAWTHALEMALNRLTGKKVRLSPSYTMWQIQGVQGDQDDFAYAASGGEGTQDGPEVAMPLVKKGCCRQQLWADDDEEPGADIKKLATDAKSYRLPAKLVSIELSDVKKVLSSGNPVHLGMNTGEGFQAIGRDGLFKAAEEPSGQHGGHAMLIVGYKGNHFIVKNSWGTEWGDKGYCYIPKKVLQASDSSFVAVLLKVPG